MKHPVDTKTTIYMNYVICLGIGAGVGFILFFLLLLIVLLFYRKRSEDYIYSPIIGKPHKKSFF